MSEKGFRISLISIIIEKLESCTVTLDTLSFEASVARRANTRPE